MSAKQEFRAPVPRPVTGSSPRRGLLGVLALPLILVVLGLGLIHHSIRDTPPPAAPSVALVPSTPEAIAPAVPEPPAAPLAPETPEARDPALPPAEPQRLSIPEIGVDAPFMPLAIGETGELDPPPHDDKNLVGWFEGGVTPGERGSSIVVGHVDTRTGPAVFVHLNALRPGSTVDIHREDGTVATFEVYAAETFRKADFPDERVYGDTPSAQLRLITCAGAYDRATRNYEDNLVVFARLDSVRET
ncbi:class F sortase [Streptomyces sp. ST2-7A]|uniref:class F sortase n=1 Tax=Streptomyces sp. ST2-7A TaxID=2907214 RepID=UPI001F45DE66|nr:class F sortase [Streptomyces sp. ST2-7A]MCE7079535.1 class F sortase [Streptomyces sp. ST2-7A]